MKLLDACDKEEGKHPQLSREEIVAKIDKINERIVELSVLKEEVMQNGTKCETDPDSRIHETGY